MLADNDEYRDRLVHEFDEDLGEYERKVRDELEYQIGHTDDEGFMKDYSKLPATDDPHVELEDDEAMTGYRHIAKGQWDKLDLGQVISLHRLVNTLKQYDDSGLRDKGRSYRGLQQATDELDYVLTLESELEQVEEDYTRIEE